MKYLNLILTGVFVACFAFPIPSSAQSNKYKCLIQMANYVGEGAYIIVSVLDAEGKYEKTLSVLGEDTKWYETLEEWNKFYEQKPSGIDGITGASVTGGARTILTLEIDPAKFDKGYKLRFESAVENNKYYSDDLEIALNSEVLAKQSDGKGYIRFVRFIKIQ